MVRLPALVAARIETVTFAEWVLENMPLTFANLILVLAVVAAALVLLLVDNALTVYALVGEVCCSTM